MGVKIVPRRGKSWMEKIYLPALFSGLKITFGHFFRNLKDTSNIETICYPEQMPKDITPRYRGVHRLTHRQDDSIRCVACFMCSTACPADCIFIEATERDDGIDEKMPKRFDIDLLECVFCGACVEACPCDAIRMDTGIFTLVQKRREDFVLNKEQLLANKPMKEDLDD
jgi:NADH-quinone oxidoreductase subunit I